MRVLAEVVVLRGAIAESRHRVTAVTSAAADTDAAPGPPLTTSFRSAAKPFQLLPFVERGHADRLGCSVPELAIMAASHSGSRAHLALVRGLLARIGLDETSLACGYHDPQDPESLADVRRNPGLCGPLYNNCSGKHAGMLAFCRAEGWPVEGYEKPGHPLQQLMLRTVAECCGVAPQSVPTGIDGCGVPVFGMPLERMAHGYARIAAAGGGDTRDRALGRIAHAMMAEPVVVEGAGRLATDLMLAAPGRLLAKSGAEGLLLVADTATGEGIAIKVEDGAMRALDPAAVEILGRAGRIDPALPGLAPHRRTVVTNAAGREVGWLEARVEPGGPAPRGPREKPHAPSDVRTG
jgi:L-asparaginase II